MVGASGFEGRGLQCKLLIINTFSSLPLPRKTPETVEMARMPTISPHGKMLGAEYALFMHEPSREAVDALIADGEKFPKKPGKALVQNYVERLKPIAKTFPAQYPNIEMAIEDAGGTTISDVLKDLRRLQNWMADQR
jgi:hypothetical protein